MSEVSSSHVDNTVAQYTIIAHTSRAQDSVVIAQRGKLRFSLNNFITKLLNLCKLNTFKLIIIPLLQFVRIKIKSTSIIK